MIRILSLTLALSTGLIALSGCRQERMDASPCEAVVASLIADSIAFGDPVQEQAHRLCTVGAVRSETLDTEIGEFKRTYPVRTLSGNGSQLSFILAKPAAASDLILEFQEIHVRRPQAHGYTLSINGVDAYFRTYDEVGGGPNHFFVRVPAAALAAKELAVSITSAGSQPFSLGRVWLYSDFFTTIDLQEQVYRPVALMREGTTQTNSTSFAPIGTYKEINFANRPREQIQETYRNYLIASATSGRPLQLLFNGPTWGGAPNGPDGIGGYFSDLRYSMLGYDAASKSWSPSYPNMWSSTFWASFRDPHMHSVLKERFIGNLTGIADTVDFLRARGMPPQVVYARELGPPLGEINAATMRAAAADGVTLDPRDGISDEERRWLHRNDVALWREYASWHTQIFPRDAVVIDRGTILPPQEQTLDKQYSHTVFTTDQGPMKSRRWFGGQAGMVEGFWSSGEVFFDRYAQYDYVKANGKLGHVNVWAPFTKTGDTLRSLYDAGFQFASFIGDKNPEYDQLVTNSILAADRCDDLPSLAPPHHEPSVLEVMYNLNKSLGPEEHIARVDNLRIHSQSRECADVTTVSRLAVSDPARPGQITYRIDNGGEPFAQALSLTVDGRVSPGARIEVLVGENESSLRLATALTDAQLPCPDHWEPFMTSKATVGLGRDLVGKQAGLVRLVFHAQHAPDAAFLMECRIATQWPRRTGVLANNGFTMRQQRTLNLWIQDRVVAERMLGRYRDLAGDNAAAAQGRRLVDAGRYRSAQRFLSTELSQLLPARFAIRSHGQLGHNPVTVTMSGSDQVLLATLHQASDTSCELSVRCDVDRQPFRISMPATDNSRWTLTTVAANRFRLTQDRAGAIKASQGRVEFSAEAVREPEPACRLPSRLVARYLEGNDSVAVVDCQDLDLMHGLSSMRLPLVSKAPMTRKPERITVEKAPTRPQRFDRVELSINDQGQVTAMDATYGRDEGRIAKLIPLSPLEPFCNGFLELENGNRYEFDFQTQVDTVALRNIARNYEWHMIEQMLRPGDHITIDYSPFTEKGTTRRLIKITQPYRELLSQQYTKSKGEDWRAACLLANGVVVKPHNAEPNNGTNLNVLMRPAEPFLPGTVIYQVRSDQPLKTTVCEFTARAFEDSSNIDFAVSTDGGTTWVSCGRFDTTWQNCYPQGIRDWKIPSQFVDLTAAVAGKQEFQLRLVLRVNSADERYALGGVRVLTAE